MGLHRSDCSFELHRCRLHRLLHHISLEKGVEGSRILQEIELREVLEILPNAMRTSELIADRHDIRFSRKVFQPVHATPERPVRELVHAKRQFRHSSMGG